MNGKFMKQIKTIVGTGFSGLDIIRNESIEYILPGGTCANVVAVLASLGWSSQLFKANYSDSWNIFVNNRLYEYGVNIIEYANSNELTPKVIQVNEDNRHYFYTVCPECKRRLVNIKLPTKNILKMIGSNLIETNIFFFDRISNGIKLAVKTANDNLIWTFYEPNSCRSYTQLLNNASEANIVKFSSDRISHKVANTLKNDLSLPESKTKLIIITMGIKGVAFSLKNDANHFSEWHLIDAIIANDIVDTSGAGDWLTAGFLDVFIDHYPKVVSNISFQIVLKALQNGQNQSQICCKSLGALGALNKIDSMSIPPQKWNCDYCMSEI